jgi:hypothetical protein
VTRAEGLAMIMRFFRIQATPDKKNSFRDVKTNTWIKAYIDTAIQKKIITANVYFRPQDMMTRAEFITILMRASKLPISTTIKNSFQDLRKTSAHTIYINNFTHFLGVRGRSFEPNKKITRGDIANIIYSFSHKYQQ